MKIIEIEGRERSHRGGSHSQKTLKGILKEYGYTDKQIDHMQRLGCIVIIPDSLRKHLEINERIGILEEGLERDVIESISNRFESIANGE